MSVGPEDRWSAEPTAPAPTIAAPPSPLHPAPSGQPAAPPRSLIPTRATVPVLLFLASCWTTYSVGEQMFGNGAIYSLPVMFILLSHELGHYVQARRYRVPASLPYFIPIPARPFGTMGAVISMRGSMGDRKSLFDIGISGPLAGLVPTLVCCIVGLHWSQVVPLPPTASGSIGEPLIFRFLTRLIFGPLSPDQTILIHPLGYAGWVGIFITSLNLFPIGQLDGGHILYALLRRKAHLIATGLLIAAVTIVVLTQQFQWMLMLMLLVMMGPNHPPTANDDIPLGAGRTVLGWLTLAFVVIGFTPTPFYG